MDQGFSMCGLVSTGIPGPPAVCNTSYVHQRELSHVRHNLPETGKSDQTDGSLGALQARIEELVVIIRVRSQSLYRQNDSNKRRHRIRKVILVEKKRLAAAVDDYNKLAEPTKQIVSSDALMQTDIWPWQSTSEPAADLQTKRKVFEKVMAVRRQREEEMILCREMRHHWTVLRMRSVVLGTISSDSSLVGMSEDAQKGLCSLVLKKTK
ncbi:hypothetical protein ACER0C_002679 [Sarotherodon galilaeus]